MFMDSVFTDDHPFLKDFTALAFLKQSCCNSYHFFQLSASSIKIPALPETIKAARGDDNMLLEADVYRLQCFPNFPGHGIIAFRRFRQPARVIVGNDDRRGPVFQGPFNNFAGKGNRFRYGSLA
jgi:hypothetical protein